ncbi:MAG: HEAT repeat domain-containing protein [Pseudohongiellaceae bacterium]
MSDTIEQQQMLIIDYLYGDWDDAQKQEFEALLESDEALRALLDEETGFNSLLPLGTQPVVDQERVDGNRWLLKQNLQKAVRPSFSVQSWLASLAQRPLSVAFQGAAMAMTFVMGVMVATPNEIGSPTSQELIAANAESVDSVSPLTLVNDEDFEIYKLKVNSYNSATGDIDLSFSLASDTRLSGNVADSNISQLMATALQDDIDSASRLDTINALQPVAQGDRVYEALIYVLTNDENPGVRYQAVRSLVALSDEEKVREALREALQTDVNQGVRIEAFNALSQYRDEQTLSVFRAQMDTDSNEYIRSQAKTILDENETSTISL